MLKKKVCILDYGSGNINSVKNIITYLKYDVIVSNQEADILKCTHLLLPGVGAFGASMNKIKNRIPLKILENEVIKSEKPFLGICVGMQILADKGYEFGENDGLGWISGKVEKLDSKSLPLPHVGWNDVRTKKESELLTGLNENHDFYFVNSYAFKAYNNENVVAETEYGSWFTSIIQKDNIFGVQFHPEKSQKAGQLLLKNFLCLT
jgi:glutamine amidotransferase